MWVHLWYTPAKPVGKITKKQSEGVHFFVNSALKIHSVILSKMHSYRLLFR